MTLSEFLPLLNGVSGSNGQYSAKCPAHDDNHASLSVSESQDGNILLTCHAGCLTADIVSALGLNLSNLFQKPQNSAQEIFGSKPKVIAEYVYTDLNGAPVAKKLRYSNKSFCWLKPNGKGGWAKGRNGKVPLFNSFNVKDIDTLYIVEGEKDVQTLSLYGKSAVSLPDGAKSKWLDSYTEFFKGRTVAIIQDNDEPGKAFAQMIAGKLDRQAKSVRVIDLSKIWKDIPVKADISDYLAAGHDIKKLSELANSTEVWKPKKDTSKYTQLSAVNSTNTEWLWYPYIPIGKITLMTADPGTGKTFFSLYLTATVSTGRPFYGQSPCQERPPRTAVYQTAEDGIADTIKPRLEPMQPNFENIFVIDESKDSITLSNYEEIEQAMKDLNPALMIFDPLQAYLGADVDMHRANEVRPVLSHIGQLAEKYKCAVIFIMHNSKMGQNQALYRALGSIDIPAIARSMLILGKNPDNPDMKVVCHEKSSLAVHGKSILFQIAPEMGGIVFNGFSDLKADDILNVKKGSRDKPSICKNEVIDRLNDLIGVDGYAKLDDIQALQEDLGCSKGTLYNAKQNLGLDSVSIGFSKNKVTYWIAPEIDKQQFKEQKEKELINSFESLSIPPF